ncbi:MULTISPECIES: type II toxin-antitoxin system ParD family antitoxin [Sphingomonas]|uniref:Type II toxin-antitoxin system ParD family antitoxin n=1 Tax=Sphingomonas kyungheensis TaxID=1069987 RepID=A0ABU8H3T9_9SPHN|nr:MULTISPECIES: type II toxin-antitoxin system ParD family antitoxin [unclassified Sphingomonas]EZP51061.1 putative transcriptional regulator [Sphingomonas sp. RIT328]
MTQLTISMPDALQEWVNTRVAQGRYVDAADYLRDLVRLDQQSDDRLWLKAMIDEGLASGVLDQDPRDVIAEIIAEDPDFA